MSPHQLWSNDEWLGLCRGIAACPQDDAERLVAADWLDEHEESPWTDWAAHIRQSCAWARKRACGHEPFGFGPKGACRHCDERRDLYAQVSANSHHWLAPVPLDAKAVHGSWRRGFPTSCYPIDGLVQIDRLCRHWVNLLPIERLEINNALGAGYGRLFILPPAGFRVDFTLWYERADSGIYHVQPVQHARTAVRRADLFLGLPDWIDRSYRDPWSNLWEVESAQQARERFFQRHPHVGPGISPRGFHQLEVLAAAFVHLEHRVNVPDRWIILCPLCKRDSEHAIARLAGSEDERIQVMWPGMATVELVVWKTSESRAGHRRTIVIQFGTCRRCGLDVVCQHPSLPIPQEC